MKGYFMQKNEELLLMVGEVQETRDEGNKYTVIIEYDHYDKDIGEEFKKQTEIFFQNQNPAPGDSRNPIMWADSVRKMKLRKGSVIAVLARPNKTGEKADGYTCRYNGRITFAPDDAHSRERNAVGGLVTWIKDDLDSQGNPCIKMGVYIGKAQDGSFLSATVKTSDEKLIGRCKKALTPKAGNEGEKPIKKYAWFRCGDAYMAMNAEGAEFPILTCFDFTITGTTKR